MIFHSLAPSTTVIDKFSFIQSDPDPETYVQTLLKTHDHYAELVKTAFNGDAKFVEGLDKASRRFVNDNAVTRYDCLFAKTHFSNNLFRSTLCVF